MIEVTTFNPDEGEMECIGRLISEQEADMAIAFDCASQKVTFRVMGFFVLPSGSLHAGKLTKPT